MGCSNLSASLFVITASVAACLCSIKYFCQIHCCRCRRCHRAVVVASCRSSTSDSLCIAAVVVIVCFRTSISHSSCAAASCLPVNLISRPSYLRWNSWIFSDDSPSSRASTDAGCLAYLVSLQRFCFCFLFSNPPLSFFLRMGIDNAQLQICGHFPSESCRWPQRQRSIFCFSCQLPRSPPVSLSHLEI